MGPLHSEAVQGMNSDVIEAQNSARYGSMSGNERGAIPPTNVPITNRYNKSHTHTHTHSGNTLSVNTNQNSNGYGQQPMIRPGLRELNETNSNNTISTVATGNNNTPQTNQNQRQVVGQSDIPNNLNHIQLGHSQRNMQPQHPAGLLNQSDAVGYPSNGNNNNGNNNRGRGVSSNVRNRGSSGNNNNNNNNGDKYGDAVVMNTHAAMYGDELANALMNPQMYDENNYNNGYNDEQKSGYPYVTQSQQQQQQQQGQGVPQQYYDQYYGLRQQQPQHVQYNYHNTYPPNNAMSVHGNNQQAMDDIPFDFANPNGDYPDFANPNNDYNDPSSGGIDPTKIQLITYNEVTLEAEIGRGSSSKVYKARWRNTEVAAKRFTPNFGIDSKKAKEYIDKYATKLLENPHENVIKILAYHNGPFTILTEYMNYGSVKNYVRRTRPGSTSISILDRIEIAYQAAKGIQHLHQLTLIHSEINCQNLLMEFRNNNDDNNNNNNNNIKDNNIGNIRVVITDYALQQMLNENELETYRSTLGPLKWMAPECIENNSSSTFQSDIYAFGITMWEIITGQEPYPDVDPVDTAIHVLVKERRPQSYAFIPEKIQNLMKQCWHKDKDKRPNADKVVQTLRDFIQTERKQHGDRNDLVN